MPAFFHDMDGKAKRFIQARAASLPPYFVARLNHARYAASQQKPERGFMQIKPAATAVQHFCAMAAT